MFRDSLQRERPGQLRIMASRHLSSLLVLALGAAAPSVVIAQPVVRDHRAPLVAGPTEAPPPPKQESWKPRRGQAWIDGQWEWRGGSWKWKAGHYEARKKNKRWTAGRWDRKGDHWEWAAGTWNDAPPQPDQPPAPLDEPVQTRRGFVWVKGYWAWDSGNWEWTPGKLEKRQRGKQWNDGAWADVGGKWTWTAGAWVDGPRTRPEPPPPRDEKPQFRRGQIWVAGHWEWDDGAYEWVPGKLQPRPRGKRWQEGKWENKGGEWSFTAGLFIDAPKEQAAPPPQIAETPGEKKGYLWVNGNYEWRDGDYEWTPGHWERERAGKSWAEGHWDNAGGTWTWTAGRWN